MPAKNTSCLKNPRLFGTGDSTCSEFGYSYPIDENDGVYPETFDSDSMRDPLTRLMDSRTEDILNSLSADQLIQVGEDVLRLQESRLDSSASESALGFGNEWIDSPAPNQFKKTNSRSRSRSRSSGRGLVGGLNLPASMPITDIRNGVEHLIFTYSTRGHVQEYTIRVNIDDVVSDDLPVDFKQENCVYPRACVSNDMYVGNRYEYETKVNDIAWRLTWINRSVLSGRRGLIQRAVDSYRNRFQESRSRRVIRQDKIKNGTLRRRVIEGHVQEKKDSFLPGPNPDMYVSVQYENKKGKLVTAKIRVDIDLVDVNYIAEQFKISNCVYPQSMFFYENSDQGHIYEYATNELGWKLAYLNSSKLAGRRNALLAAIEAFQEKFDPEKNYQGYIEGSDEYQSDSNIMSYGLLPLGRGSDYLDSVEYDSSQAYDYSCYAQSGIPEMVEHGYYEN